MDKLVGLLLSFIISLGTTVGVAPEKITHNGSRTGPRVEYQEWCTGKPVFIYENEKIPYATESGTVLWTQGDIDCYKTRKLTDNNTPTPFKQIKQTAQTKTQATVTRDGSRSGRIISYKEYCSGNQISVYENEILTRVSAFDGKTYSMTQGDWDCYAKNSQGGETNTNTSTYLPCTIYYPLLKYSGTYYISTDECTKLRNSVNSISNPRQINTFVQTPTQTAPTPTPNNSEYNDLLRRHQEACTQAASEWIGVRERWEQDNQSNYSSSAEMVMALRQRMAQYQQELYSAGCTQTISLY